MKNWSFARTAVVAVAHILIVCALGIMWLLWRVETESAISDDVYIMMDDRWMAAFVVVMLLPPVVLLIAWLIQRRQG